MGIHSGAPSYSFPKLLYDRIFMEVITYNNGYYGRFLILIKFGLGCTVWYGFTPGIEYLIPVDSLVFQEISNFDPFLFIPEYHIQPGFDKMTLLEKEENNILSVLQAAFKSEKPFMDIHLPTDDGKWDENLPDLPLLLAPSHFVPFVSVPMLIVLILSL